MSVDAPPPPPDPRLKPPDPGSEASYSADESTDVLLDPAPSVAVEERPWVMWAGIGGAGLLGVIVFTSLLAGQQSIDASDDFADTAAIDPGNFEQVEVPPFLAPPPPPFIPPPTAMPPAPKTDEVPSWQGVSPPPVARLPLPPPPPPPLPRPLPPPPPPFRPPTAENPGDATTEPTMVAGANDLERRRSPALVVDLGRQATAATITGNAAAGAEGAAPLSPATGGARSNGTVSARRLTNPGMTVPQGALIGAVLETAINSDLPGFVRAVVSRDVRSFDGSRVLIPRGSRLIGQYDAEVAIGQSRALVVWNRLIRTDGTSVDLESPGTDSLGRAGLTGRVDRHYWERFGPSFLISAISAALTPDRGTQVVLGTAQAATAPQGQNIAPTVTVPQGTAIQVFVSRDLDFSSVSGR